MPLRGHFCRVNALSNGPNAERQLLCYKEVEAGLWAAEFIGRSVAAREPLSRARWHISIFINGLGWLAPGA